MLAGHKLPLVARRPEEGSSLDVAPAVGAGAEARRRGTHRGRMFLPSITYALESSFYRHPGPSESEIFDELVLRHGSSDSLALDLGCGRGAEGHDYRGMLGRVLGCDRDPRALSNPYLDEVVIADLEDLPFAEASFDLVFSRAVFEHLERPATVFGEIRRVLKPGGRLVVMTPNRNHYVTLISRLTPHWFHRLVGRVRDVSPRDVFPTFYRANTLRRLRLLCVDAALKIESIGIVEGKPAYVTVTPVTYVLGIVYERLVNSARLLQPFRSSIFLVARRP